MIPDLINIFRLGGSVSDPAKWKTGGITVTILAPFLVAVMHIANHYGCPVVFDTATADAIALGIIAFIGSVFPVITTDKIGLLPRSQSSDEATGAPTPRPFPNSD